MRVNEPGHYYAALGVYELRSGVKLLQFRGFPDPDDGVPVCGDGAVFNDRRGVVPRYEQAVSYQIHFQLP